MLANWTLEQLSAIETSGCDLLVAAAAGAGKTAVLVERIIKKIIDETNPTDIDSMLIVTFTNAAAAEMRERIGDALGKELEKKTESQKLQRQMLLLNKASITTIHSFCMDVVKNNFHMLDLDPDFRIADETESVLLKLEAVEELFESKYEEEDKDFIYLLDRYGGNKDDKKLQDMVLDIFEFVQSSPWPDEWLKKACEAYYTGDEWDFSKTSWARIIMEHAGVEIEGALNQLMKAEQIAFHNPGYGKCAAQLADDINAVKLLRLSAGESWNKLYEAYGSINFARQQGPDKTADKTDYETLKALRKEAKERISSLGDGLFNCSSEDIKGDLDSLYPVISGLCSLVTSFCDIYQDKKKEKGIIDFNDLEHFCLQILTIRDDEGRVLPSPAALSIRDRFKELLVDEYQDSNLVQEAILTVISKRDEDKPNMFMVGDVKQSIYRFRQAKPELFLDKYKRYLDTEGSKERKIKLFKNFRSRKEVLDGVNFLFRQLMSLYIGEIDYDEEEFLNPGALYPDDAEENDKNYHAIELDIIDMKKEETVERDHQDEESSESEDMEDLDSIQAEARLIGERILGLMGLAGENPKPFRIYDKALNGYRNLQYKDIVILLRTVRGWSEVFMQELEAMGIPAFADTGTGFFRRSEVQIVMSLLQVIDNPMQDIPLISVLRSAITGFTSEELMEVRLEDKDSSYYEALKKASLRDDGLGSKTKAFLERLEVWRDKSLHLPTDELIWYLLRDTGYYSYAGAMPQGLQRQANLKALFERAKQYEETSFKGLFNFINFINKLKQSSGDMGNAKILGENDDVVRIMSIHKSKGLEFPVVIIGGTGKQFNLRDASNTMLLHEELGFGIDLMDPQRRITYATVPKLAIQNRIKLESLSEEMRVLYVALTRAKEKLIITGCDRNLDRSVNRWAAALDSEEDKLKPDLAARSSRYLDWLGQALVRHQDSGLFLKKYGIDNSSAQKLAGDESRWFIKVWKKENFLREKSQMKESEGVTDMLRVLDQVKENAKLNEEIVGRLEWVYPHEKAAKIPVKLSVTELKRIGAEAEDGDYVKGLFKSEHLKKPRFLEGRKTMSAAERGSAMHYVMQHLDLYQTETIEAIQAQVRRLYEEEYITEEWTKAVDIKRIYSFFDSPLGRRIRRSKKVCREMPFNIEVNAGEAFHDADMSASGETILVQGVIDLYFLEEDKLTLLDYKTDYVDKDNIETVISRYRTQMSFYEKALQIALKRKVDEKYIYLFHIGEAVKL